MNEGVGPGKPHQLVFADQVTRMHDEHVKKIESPRPHPQRLFSKHQQLPVRNEPVVPKAVCFAVQSA
ncbi:hypothetical protein [Chelatococcus asaccharovorans]|uniref:hypothetical protein n=1 Tax=Chelatococcus asaccharovorans TaxID=28210 RepID=UPI001FE09960|nr:hypothetical protein [Chelatococcus asaccharovorans]